MRQPCRKRCYIKEHPTARLGRLGVRRRHGGHTAIDRCGKKSRSGIMAPWAPYVCVRVIGSVAPASRKQLIPTDGCCSTTTTTTFQPDPFQYRVPGGGQIENSKKQRTRRLYDNNDQNDATRTALGQPCGAVALSIVAGGACFPGYLS